MNILKYKEYEGTAEVDTERMVCRGKILFINDLVTYEGKSPSELQRAFEEAVEDYLATCRELNRDAQKPHKGLFQVRISPALHRQCAVRAAAEKTTLNDLVGKALSAYVGSKQEVNNNFHVTFVQPDNKELEKGFASTSPATSFITERVSNGTTN